MNPKKSPTGIFDKNGKEVLHNDTIMLSGCKCCFYKVVWDEDNERWHPKDDGMSQVHGEHIDVWEQEFEVANE